jgi:hypothetical protein
MPNVTQKFGEYSVMKPKTSWFEIFFEKNVRNNSLPRYVSHPIEGVLVLVNLGFR